MPQQINLYSPILQPAQRQFSAPAMLGASAALAAGLAVLCAWSLLSTARLRSEVAAATAAGTRQRQALDAAIQARGPAAASPAALEQELAQARKQLDERRALLAQLAPAGGPGGAALLRLLAQTAPATLWLTEVRHGGERIEIAGVTDEPEALRAWLKTLAQQPPFAGRALRAVKVERGEGEHADRWRFRAVSGREPVEAP